ncbi:MAG: TIM44-like domain-containing protein [Bacilli bacterium]|nr:TIM44-like domain-containing protein [Bacilli bacterium]
MKKLKLTIYKILIVLAVGIIVPTAVYADSGWDSDYGGSDWGSSSSSDWGSSSSSDWDSFDHDYGSSSSYRSSGRNASSADHIFFTVVTLLILFYYLYIIARAFGMAIKTKSSKGFKYENIQDTNAHIGDDDSLVKQFFPDLTEAELINNLYQKFIEIQKAWMDFDYAKLEELCTAELYESYKSDLAVLKRKHGQNIMNDFDLVVADIIDIKEENGIIIVSVYMHVVFYDYVINTGTKKIIRGSDNSKLHNHYNLEYIISSDSNELVCPNCGAKIEAGNDECQYCHSHVGKTYNKIVLSKKSKV